MNNIAVINLISVQPWFYKPVKGDESQLERLETYTKSLTGVSEYVFLTEANRGIPGKNCVEKETWSEHELIKELLRLSEGYDNVIYYWGDCPLLDTELSNKMIQTHRESYSEYTFADGYPRGLAPEITDSAILAPLVKLSKEMSGPVTRDTFFNVVKKDINSFELETEISPRDLRLYRISLTTDCLRNFHQVKRFIEAGAVDAETITGLIENREELLLTEPAYIQVEISKKNIQNVSYLPKRASGKEFMDMETLDAAIEKVKEHCDDAVWGFSTESEPSTHPAIGEILRKIAKVPGFSLYIDTSGLGWKQEDLDFMKASDNIHTIFCLDALESTIYSELRGEGQSEAWSKALELINACPERTWVQAVRMYKNEEDIEKFYRYWQEHTSSIIIQKYNNYCGTLSNEKVTDLSPLTRKACWHIKRDLFIDTEGDILLCFNDLNKECVLGNIQRDSLKDVEEKRQEQYEKHLKQDYNTLCRNCDEYYTYNF